MLRGVVRGELPLRRCNAFFTSLDSYRDKRAVRCPTGDLEPVREHLGIRTVWQVIHHVPICRAAPQAHSTLFDAAPELVGSDLPAPLAPVPAYREDRHQSGTLRCFVDVRR